MFVCQKRMFPTASLFDGPVDNALGRFANLAG
jgi:hypothetical protein